MTNVITIDVAGFKKVLDTMKGIISTKNSLPILGDVKLDYRKDSGDFTLTGSNGDARLTVVCAERKIDEDGKTQSEPCISIHTEAREGWQPVCIDYQRLREIFAVLPAARCCTVTLTEDGNARTMEIDYQDGKLSLPYESAIEYPEPVEVVTVGSPRGDRRRDLETEIQRLVGEQGEEAQGLASLRTELGGIPEPVCRFTVDARTVLTALREAKTCTADDELRPVMNGVCFDTYIDHLVIVASDGHKMYKNVLDTGMGFLEYKTFAADQSAALILPKQSMAAVSAAFAGADRMTLTADTQVIQLEAEGVNYVTRCIEGRYPNYESVIPRDNPYKVQMSRDTLRMALRRVGLSSDSSSNMVTFHSDGTAFTISAADMEFSRSGSERVPIQQTDAFLPEGFTIGMKLSNTLELLDLLDEDSIVFFFSDPSRAFLLRNESPKAQAKTLLQMPMLVNEA
jgi:DNA polymerase-3 subunit beta